MTGSDSALLTPMSDAGRTVALRELPRKLAHIQTLWQKLLYVHWDPQSLELVRRLVHEIRTTGAALGLAAGAESARKLEQQLQMLQSRSGPPPETERGRFQGMLQRLAHVLLEAHAGLHEDDAGVVVGEPPAISDAKAPVSAAGEQQRRIYILTDSCRPDEPWIMRLGHAGYRVRLCAELAELRRAMQHARPEMILAEVALGAGGLSGIEAIDALHSEFGKDTPVLFIGARGDLDARLVAVRAGAAGYFLKPLDEQELFRCIEELLPRKPLNYRVLVVEDEEQLASAYALVLQQAGFTAQVLTTPLRVLDALQQFQPDVVLMDLHLAQCSGLELMQLIRQDPAYCALPILFLSADTDPVRHNEVLSQGAELFLLKPIKPAQLIAAIGSRVGRARSLRQRLQWLSQRDALTGLLNRHALRARLDRRLLEWQRQETQPATLLYIEPDCFRALRDRLGMAAADLLLADLAVWLKDRLSVAADLAHLGEACFCALLECDAAETRDRAAQICQAAGETTFHIGRESISITLSIGVATPQMRFRSGEDWLGAAAIACDVAHDAGGGRVELQREAAMNVADHEQHARYAQLLREALRTDGLYCVYQPIMNLHGQPVERYDVLLRMRDGDARELNVERMFAVAKTEGLQLAVDRWVIEHVLAVLQRRVAAGDATVFFIKLSADSLADPAAGAWIAQRVEDAQVDTRQLVFEFTEADVAAAVLSAGRLFARLHALGCGIALEHFGAAAGTARVVGRLPVDYVKIDASLIRRPQEWQRIRALLEHSSAAGVQVIAGFVEDAASLAALWQWGVQYIQGNFLQAPAAALDFDFRDELVE